MHNTIVAVLLLLLVVTLVISGDSITHPVVTLSHGGQVKGIQTKVEDGYIAMFAGIPFAKPPVQELRFKKPEPAGPWSGVLDTSVNKQKACPQLIGFGENAGQFFGDEDCLVLDVYVPGGVIPSEKKKAVMVWIHGGGYIMGSGTSYPHMILSMEGDVVIVSINYRLGALGFISNGEGTGNFALWDQKQALVWVQENIAQFGGDSSKVTIFGESAGGGSVSALTMSAHTEGLFHRAIPQSGSLFTYWSWGHTELSRNQLATEYRSKFNCSSHSDLYDCLRPFTPEELLNSVLDLTKVKSDFQPYRDNDFFSSADVDELNYKASQRFDMMRGYNSQEGLLFISFIGDMFLAAENKTLAEHGLTPAAYDQMMYLTCMGIDKFAPELCMKYFENLYEVNKVKDDKERAFKFVDIATDVSFSADSWRSLEQHAGGDKSTYAYWFTEPYRGKGMWPTPRWLKTTADHGDDIFFMLGGKKLQRNMDILLDVFFGGKLLDPLMEVVMKGAPENDETYPLAEQVMCYWTNFAKTGNPNLPIKSKNKLEWPEYTTEKQQVMELSMKAKVTTVPRLEHMKALDRDIIPITKRQHAAEDKLPPTPAVSILSVLDLTVVQASQVIIALAAVILILLVRQIF